MLPTFAVLMLAFAEAVTVVGPAYPPNAIAGGNVVALLHVSAGSVKQVEILQGDPPFVAPARASLGSWRFKATENSNVLVVVNFRSPNLYSTGSAAQKLAVSHPVPGALYPTNVIEPAYPPNSMAEGSVVLHLDVTEAGSVSSVKVVQGLGSLTAACSAAARQWRFVPARNQKGMVTASEAYAVCVVRRPILLRK
ncbi:MAG: energy transducer TonB [Acidobacteriia bacterium]|nr:energy transducer TonB [Terriglobia bacterium]